MFCNWPGFYPNQEESDNYDMDSAVDDEGSGETIDDLTPAFQADYWRWVDA